MEEGIQLRENNILVVDDEDQISNLLSKFIERRNPHIKVHTASHCKEAFNIFKKYKPKLIFMDYRMAGKNGIEQCREMRRYYREGVFKIVLITGSFSITNDESLKMGFDWVVCKPFKLDDILIIVDNVFRQIP